MKPTEFEKGCIVCSRYEVVRPVGSGGTSTVYLVIDRHIGRTLAMKVMDRGALGAFRFARSEIESLRCVRYPLFPAIHDAFCDERYIYIISEYVKGRCLTDVIRNDAIGRDRALSLAERICGALIYLHEMSRPILYLDLKPDNIIIDDEGLPHLIDFGIAGWLAAKHIPVGTIGYSPPEQYGRSGMMDARTDIFAFGMTYYSIRCGVPPDADPVAALANIRHSSILSSSERSFLTRCCAISQEDRYPCAREVFKQIRHIRSTPKRIRRKLVFAAVTAGILTTGVYVFTGVTRRIRQNEAAAALCESVTQHMEEGEYTPEGIRIIRACISSGMLSKECEQEFIFEVASNSMLISKDYKTAAAYFAKLDPERYPEAEDYMKLCSLAGSFDERSDEAQKLAGKLFADIMGRTPSKMKYENLIFIAECYESFDPDRCDGLVRSLSVLSFAGQELDDVIKDADDPGDADEYESMRERIRSISAVKEKRLAILKKNRMIGENYEKNKKDL